MVYSKSSNHSQEEEKPRSDTTSAPESRNTLDAVLHHEPKEAQKIVREGLILAGGAVAILLQVANPGVGAGVHEHSNFAYRPVDRLRTTMTYIYCITFGSPAEKAAIISMVHNAHSTVKGKGYSADDPELQMWVAATLYAAGTDIYEKVFGSFSSAEAERIYQDYSVLATALRVPPEMWPADRRAFWAYWDAMIESFEITNHAKSVAHDLLYSKRVPIWIRAGLLVVRLLTAEWLPSRLREAYGLKTSKIRRTMYAVFMGITRGVYPHLPRFAREYPKHYYMKDMRKRMKDIV
ncbi:hypothetical protein AJ79_00723 [Helicocarpus griseus UAMH5409]|uniref:ER-bound oxygenase mpaB/mpaB'/Rubber oxygenase catalytic domain-containing protein n=1 Tax=Helicocarpus griseus UAMH5409 TaxID=1447875 RepID=A0A2B7YA12_9EURO|nr:hypothetical protein AJ79_00723 [Helicocarpus griseus UAMH5409]